MALEIVVGAAVGTAFGAFYNAIRDAVKTTSEFRSLFETIEATCEEIEPLLRDIHNLSKMDGHPQKVLKRMLDLMEGGKKLVTECSKVGGRDVYKRYSYGKKLVKLDDEIKRFFLVKVQAITLRNVMELSLCMKEMLNALGIPNGGQAMIAAGVGAVNPGVGGGCYVKTDGPEAPSFVVGVDVQFQDVKSKLLRKGVSVIVVSGPGGCGKTTLVQKIYHDPEIQDNFKEHAYFLTAPQPFDAVLTVQKMYHDKGLDASSIQTEDDAFNALKELLATIRKPILLVLDDVWSELKSSKPEPSESESLLRKFVIRNIPDYKILVTSRFEFPSVGSPVRLEPLSHHYAKQILLNAAKTLTGDLLLPKEPIVDEMVKQCKGFPLALEVVGKSLSGRHPSCWECKLCTLAKGNTILDSNSDILNCLQKSLDDLSSKSAIKDCFMDLGSFPEDHMIPACALIDMWAELHDVDGEDVYAMSNLHELSYRSLVKLVGKRNDEEGYEDQFVMQHDLLRQLAIHQSNQEPINQRRRLMLHIRRNILPKWWSEQKEQPVNANLLSISTDEWFSATWPDMDVHMVEVVLLNFRTQQYTLPKFMERMTRLKALIVANNSFLPAVLTNIALLASLSSLKRVRLERISIPLLQMENIKLTNLQKISLFMCDISKEVLDSEIQIHDAMPNLLEISVAYCKNLKKLPARLCDATSLKKISITNCPDLFELPQTIGNLSNLEILRLNSCTNLQELPNAIGNLENLKFLDISDCIEIEDLPCQIGKLSNLEEFHMTGWLKLDGLPSSVKKLRSLRLVTCHESKASLWNQLYLSNVEVKVVKEEISLIWLQNSLIWLQNSRR